MAEWTIARRIPILTCSDVTVFEDVQASSAPRYERPGSAGYWPAPLSRRVFISPMRWWSSLAAVPKRRW